MSIKAKPVFVLIIISLVTLVSVFAFIYVKNKKSGPESKMISVAVYDVVENVIYAAGSYLDNDGKLIGNEETVKFEVKVASDTKFIKMLWYLPPDKEIEAAGGFWYPDKLKKETVSGSLDDFKSKIINLPVTIKTTKNIFGKEKITASEVSYIETISPETL